MMTNFSIVMFLSKAISIHSIIIQIVLLFLSFLGIKEKHKNRLQSKMYTGCAGMKSAFLIKRREAPHFWEELSSVLAKKVGDFYKTGFESRRK